MLEALPIGNGRLGRWSTAALRMRRCSLTRNHLGGKAHQYDNPEAFGALPRFADWSSPANGIWRRSLSISILWEFPFDRCLSEAGYLDLDFDDCVAIPNIAGN